MAVDDTTGDGVEVEQEGEDSTGSRLIGVTTAVGTDKVEIVETTDRACDE